MGGYQEKHKCTWLLGRFRPLPSPLIKVSRDLFLLLFLVERERDLHSGDFPLHVNVSYKRVTSTQFSECFLYILFLKNNPKKAYFVVTNAPTSGAQNNTLEPHAIIFPIDYIIMRTL